LLALVPLIFCEGGGDHLADSDGIEKVHLVGVKADALGLVGLAEPMGGGGGEGQASRASLSVRCGPPTRSEPRRPSSASDRQLAADRFERR
jgi:hypothetical protein